MCVHIYFLVIALELIVVKQMLDAGKSTFLQDMSVEHSALPYIATDVAQAVPW